MAKITPEIAERIMELAPYHSSRQIAEILFNEAGISISHTAVANVIREQRRERAEVSKGIVQDYLKTALPTDLEMLQKARDMLGAWLTNDNLRISERLMVIDRLTKVIDTRLKYSGAGEQDAEIVVKWADDDEPE